MKWPQFLTFPRNPDFTVRQGGTDYLQRWWVIPRNKWFNIYLHKFVHSDEDRALHDHPWWNMSLLLKGSYVEIMPGPSPRAVGRRRLMTEHTKVRSPGRPVIRRPTSLHRVELINGKPVWSLFITGPTIREWGFACPQGWRHWKDFVSVVPGGNDTGKGCD